MRANKDEQILMDTHSSWSQLRSTGYGSFRMRMSESYSDGCRLWATILATITENNIGKRKLICPVTSNTIMAVEMVWVAAPDIAAAPTHKQKKVHNAAVQETRTLIAWSCVGFFLVRYLLQHSFQVLKSKLCRLNELLQVKQQLPPHQPIGRDLHLISHTHTHTSTLSLCYTFWYFYNFLTISSQWIIQLVIYRSNCVNQA